MAEYKTPKVRCPKCGKTMRTIFTPIVNGTKSPKLREKILSKEFFRCTCKKCGHRAMLLTRCLYVDEQRGFMVYLMPEFDGSRLMDAKVERLYPEMRHMTRRVVTGINRLKEKILLFESGLDDQAIELSKLALVGVIARRRTVNIQEVYFNELNEKDDRIGFTFFTGSDNEPVNYRTRAEIYQASREVAEDHRAHHSSEGFENIDLRWAAQVIAEYRSAEQEEA